MENVKMVPKTKIEQLPKIAGVYLFFARRSLSEGGLRKPIYIGKAINIRERVKNHLQPARNASPARQPDGSLGGGHNDAGGAAFKDNILSKLTTKVGFIETQSEIEALILEANFIKKYLPKFNVVWRDDKNYFYVAITKAKKPVVFITHQKNNINATYLGPFVEGNALKKTLKYLRRAFPYYTSERHPPRPCTWCHLGLCPGPDSDLKEYKKNIKKLVLILQGRRKTALRSLKKEMEQLSKKQAFEKAKEVRDKMHALQRIMDHARIIESVGLPLSDQWQKTQYMLQEILGFKNQISKIECYDISNIQGKHATGSMAVFVNGSPDKSQYRKFRIRMKQEPNDIAMLKEVLERRFNNMQWPYPQIMLIDGGIAQLNVAIKTKNQNTNTKKIKVISIAKRFKELFIEGKKEPMLLKKLPQEIFNLIVYLDDEAHRFAIIYHEKLRKKALGLDKVL